MHISKMCYIGHPAEGDSIIPSELDVNYENLACLYNQGGIQ